MSTNNYYPIAMRCNQEQWEDIKPLLDKHYIEFKYINSFNITNYLVNNYAGDDLTITNVSRSDSRKHDRKVYEEWDKDIFLSACGINDKFVLPEKWCLKITDENRADVNYWRRNIVKYRNSDCPSSYITENGCGDCGHNGPKITTEQFYKYVLNKKEMNTEQTLTRAQLISLHNQFNCNTWNTEIKSILSSAPLATDNTKIEIPQACIDKLIKDGSKDQKVAVEELGLKLVTDKSVEVHNVNISLNNCYMMQSRIRGEYAGRAFWVNNDFNWELKEDTDGELLLIPTKK